MPGRLSILCVLMLSISTAAHAQDANSIIGAARAALGTPDTALDGRVSEGELHMQGRAAPLRVVQGSAGRFLLEATFPIGKLRRGYDGEIAWEVHPLRGARLLGDAETELLQRNAALNPLDVTLAHFTDAEMLPARRQKGREFHVIRFSNNSGKSETWYFDAETHFPARIERDVQAGPGGSVHVFTQLEDWRRVDGVALPFHIVTGTATSRIEHRYRSVTHNAQLDATAFSPPEQVRALLAD